MSSSVKVCRGAGNAGFFYCCSVRLMSITCFYNENDRFELPVDVDSSLQFRWYKPSKHVDVTFKYFRHYNEVADDETLLPFPKHPVDHRISHQFQNYQTLKYEDITPFMEKYFSPQPDICAHITRMQQKYTLDYENTCVLFYRGNDKSTETTLCPYDDLIVHGQRILKDHPSCRILIQSDETDFIEHAMNAFQGKAFYFQDEIRHIRKDPTTTVDKVVRENIDYFSQCYLAITCIMAKCKWVVCTSGNCSLFILYYRGNANNVYQFLNGTWYCPQTHHIA